MMRIELSETGPGPRPLYLTLDDEAEVARTVQVVRGELMVDLDAAGRLLGIEVLTPALIVRIPEILTKYGVPVPDAIRFDKLAEAMTTAPAA